MNRRSFIERAALTTAAVIAGPRVEASAWLEDNAWLLELTACEKYFWRNSREAYRWIKRP